MKNASRFSVEAFGTSFEIGFFPKNCSFCRSASSAEKPFDMKAVRYEKKRRYGLGKQLG